VQAGSRTPKLVVSIQTVAEPGLSRTPGRVLSIDVHKLTVQKIHENINGKIDNIKKRHREVIYLFFISN